MTGATPVVRVRHAAAGYGATAVLSDVDLEVSEGEVVAILGTNGSGKSTLVKTVIGLLPLDAGEVDLFGVPLARFRRWEQIGYVPQRTTAAGGVPATVREIVAMGRLPRIPWWRRTTRSDRAAIEAAIDQVGLGEQARRPVSDLSGGQQQRVLIARALATDPSLLVLDEPTAGVDHQTQEVLARTLSDRLAAGCSVLLVAHELGPLLPLIDRAVVMRDGHVAYSGTLTPTLITQLEADHVHPHGPTEHVDQWGL